MTLAESVFRSTFPATDNPPLLDGALLPSDVLFQFESFGVVSSRYHLRSVRCFGEERIWKPVCQKNR